jgi:hypothetical protein
MAREFELNSICVRWQGFVFRSRQLAVLAYLTFDSTLVAIALYVSGALTLKNILPFAHRVHYVFCIIIKINKSYFHKYH